MRQLLCKQFKRIKRPGVVFLCLGIGIICLWFGALRAFTYSWADAKSRAAELIQAFGLEEAGKRQVKQYSSGMRRLDIAASLVVSPDLLFLDDPTTRAKTPIIEYAGSTDRFSLCAPCPLCNRRL